MNTSKYTYVCWQHFYAEIRSYLYSRRISFFELSSHKFFQGPNSDDESCSPDSSSKFYSANEFLTSEVGHISVTSSIHARSSGTAEATLPQKESQTSFRELLMRRIKAKSEKEKSSQVLDQDSLKNVESLPQKNSSVDCPKSQIQKPSSGIFKQGPSNNCFFIAASNPLKGFYHRFIVVIDSFWMTKINSLPSANCLVCRLNNL